MLMEHQLKEMLLYSVFWINKRFSDIIAVADKNSTKYGLNTLTDIPIISEEEARKESDVFFIWPYGFTDEFILREQPMD